MEEVDRIIIDQLLHIGCIESSSYVSLSELENEDIINSLIQIINLIDKNLLPNCKFSNNLNISEKYKISTDLANAFARLDYKANFGYQIFFYFEEKELRRAFLFLFDKLSKLKKEKAVIKKKTLIDNLKDIEINFSEKPIKETFKWNTNGLFYLNCLMKNQLNTNEVNFENPCLFIEWNSYNLGLNKKIFSNISTESVLNLKSAIPIEKEIYNSSPSKYIVNKNLTNEIAIDNQTELLKNNLEELENTLNIKKSELISKKEELKYNTEKLNKIIKDFNEKEFDLKKIQLVDKSDEKLNNDINKVKLEINKTKDKWVKFENEYDLSIKELKDKKSLAFKEVENFNQKILQTKENFKLNQQKLFKFQNLSEELKKNLSHSSELNRDFYTQRIFEIIKNVKKQDNDIEKVLVDIRSLQREVNSLFLKVSHRFQVIEGLIMKNLNEFEWAKLSYKLLKELDMLYENLINEIESGGQIKREILRLEEILETEKSNKIGSRLAKITFDLDQICKTSYPEYKLNGDEKWIDVLENKLISNKS